MLHKKLSCTILRLTISCQYYDVVSNYYYYYYYENAFQEESFMRKTTKKESKVAEFLILACI